MVDLKSNIRYGLQKKPMKNNRSNLQYVAGKSHQRVETEKNT